MRNIRTSKTKLRMRSTLGFGLILGLSACATNANLSTGPRSVSIENGATPAAAVLSPNMNSLIQRTSPTYVTLIITESTKSSGARKNEILTKALTSGSGFIIDPAGYVLTAGHVALKLGNSVEARNSNGKIYNGKVIGVQRSPDIALLKLSNFSGTAVSPNSTPCLAKGSAVFSLGKPHAKGDTARIGQMQSMSFGRPVSYNGFGYPDAMVVRMSTRKGESGGPLFNQRAQLSGMMVSTLSDGKGHSLNLAHAISADMLAKFACSKFSCSSSWRRLAKSSYRNCKA